MFGLHSFRLCTVGQAMHAERLESLWRAPSNRPTPWFFKIKDANASLLLPLQPMAVPTFAIHSLCFLCCFSCSLKTHVNQRTGKQPCVRAVHICSVDRMPDKNRQANNDRERERSGNGFLHILQSLLEPK